jgi:hypothetical protein
MRYEKQVQEVEFVNQLWNKINKYLFNFIDSVILIDALITMFTKNELEGVPELSKYLSDVANITEDNNEEVQKNMKHNSKFINLITIL